MADLTMCLGGVTYKSYISLYCDVTTTVSKGSYSFNFNFYCQSDEISIDTYKGSARPECSVTFNGKTYTKTGSITLDGSTMPTYSKKNVGSCTITVNNAYLTEPTIATVSIEMDGSDILEYEISIDETYVKITRSYTVAANFTITTLTVKYDSNGADVIKYGGVNISEADLAAKTSSYTYGTYYGDGLRDGNHSQYLYCEKANYETTGCWNTEEDGNGYSVNWGTGYYAEDLAKALGVDLHDGDQTVTVYLEWKVIPRFTCYRKVGNIWQEGIMYVKTNNGWKKIIDMKQN